MRSPVASVRRTLAHLARDVVQRTREQTRPTVSWALRLTGASTASYIVAQLVFPRTIPLTAALTALIITQLTLHSVVRHSIDRVLSVLIGVFVAIAFTSVLGLTWWSLALLIAAATIAGQMFRVGPNLVEVPISAMLVMGVGTHQAAASGRVIETVIGTGVGLLINALLPPGVRDANAGEAIRRFASEVSALLDKAAAQLADDPTKEQASSWLASARKFADRENEIDRVLSHAEEARRLNVRALASHDSTRALRQGLESVEHCAVSIRSMFRGINDVVHFAESVDEAFYPAGSRALMADAMDRLSATVSTFGELVAAQVHGPGYREQERLLLALEHLNTFRQSSRARVAALNEPDPMVQEVNSFLVVTVGRVLRELDLRGHTWVDDRRAIAQADQRHRALVAAKRLTVRTREMALTRSRWPRS